MTAIEWTHRPGTVGRVWNPVTGCTKVSEGCRHCYAETVATRFWGTQYPDWPARPRRFTDVLCHEDRLNAPLSWWKPATVFVNSMSDLFHEAVPDEFIDRVFAVMALCPGHTFIVLTKRPERMRDFLLALDAADGDVRPIIPARIVDAGDGVMLKDDPRQLSWDFPAWPLPNVWLGVSVEDQVTADKRIPLLLQTSAALHLVSAEPLLGPVDLTKEYFALRNGGRYPFPMLAPEPRTPVIEILDWLIVGGESGPQARPCDVAWIRSLVSQAKNAGVPCFVKQLGSFPLVPACRDSYHNWSGAIGVTRDDTKMFRAYDDTRWRVLLSSRKGSYSSEWPHSLRVRKWPLDARRAG